MKTVQQSLKSLTGIIACNILLIAHTGCGQYGHKREEKKIQRERIQEQKATSDLGDAVTVTDEAAWDATDAYRKFCDTTKTHLDENKQTLQDMEQRFNKSPRKVSLRYRKRIRKLVSRNEEMEQRMVQYRIHDKAGWEDFTTLYRYDLDRLERDIERLSKH